MLSQKISKTFDIGDGREITIETGRLARQADGSVTVRMGNSILLATVVANREPKEGQDFFPLSVDYMEKMASAGRIPGSFFKREGRLSDSEILVSRLIDRALRPLFPEDYLCEVQVIVTLISSDVEVMPDALACLAASAALAVSDIPIQEVISEVRVSKIGGQYVINPTRTQMESSELDFIIAATRDNIMMVEGEAKECSEDDLVKALEIAHNAIRIQIKAQDELREMVGVTGKREYTKPATNEALQKRVYDLATESMKQLAKGNLPKQERKDTYKAIFDDILLTLAKEENLPEGEEVSTDIKKLVKKYLADLQYDVVRDMILNDKVRLDGRGLEDVRPLDMEVDILPTPHGAALFTRGETQSLTTVTLGTPLDELLVETAGKSVDSKFYLHYNFPPFSTGEVKFLRGASRREIGHGKLAERSLKQMMPDGDYAYTVRIVSDVLESNGSSSMATVCAGSLALMDAGVPVPKHVAGVAMGLISKEGKYAVLTDILGDEDYLGDMDFKVTGTRDGICGIQMDIKVDGLSMEIMRNALEQARRGRLHILDAMYNCIDAARSEVKPHSPRMVKMFIDREFIGAVIGPGGKVIQEIQRETGTTINIEEKNNQGEVSIFGTDKEKVEKAHSWVKGIVSVPVEGDEYEAIVKSIMPYGAFVEFLPGKQGLLHISEVSWKRLDTLEGILNEGDKIKVRLTGTDPKTGKFKLSRKVMLPKPEGMQEERRVSGGERREERRDDRPRFDNNRRDDRPQGEKPKLQRNNSNDAASNNDQQEQNTSEGENQ